MKTLADAFITQHVSLISPLQKNIALAYFTATLSWKKEDYDLLTRQQIALEQIYTDPEAYQKILSFLKEKETFDPLVQRQLTLLLFAYTSKQWDKQLLEDIILRQNTVENTFATFRPVVNWVSLSDNEILNILKTSCTSEEVKEAWIASKKIWPLVADDVIALVKMRNTVAQQLWYDNYHTMSLSLDEQDPQDIERLFDELDVLTRDAFAQEKEKIDEFLAKRFALDKKDLMPRHYQDRFFQEPPKLSDFSLDSYYATADIVELSRSYYASIWLPVDSILAKSDLFEREGKYQHAYCISIDKEWDVRIVCNITSNYYRMGTQLHELWHAVYEAYMDTSIPYLLRDPAHTFTTEAIAMLFGRFAAHPQWIADALHISSEEQKKIKTSCFSSLRLQQLTFSRWAQVMYRFEKALYNDPDQDLTALWRNLVEHYQLLTRPAGRNEPDRATKIHIACYPCYYHNYLLWELLASQLYYYIITTVLHSSNPEQESFFNKPEVGTYLQEKIFRAWRIYHWNDMIKNATWENLTPKYYAKQFVS